MNAVFPLYNFINKRAFDSKMRSLKKNNIFKRTKYSEMLVKLQCHISEAVYKNLHEKKKEAQAGIEPALFCFQVEYLTNYTIVDSICARKFSTAYII
jgi:hypothetical protein